MKKMFFYLAAVISFFFISSCDMDVGLGKEVDLVAPEITVISPETLSNVHKNFVITGTCKDNVGVTSVEIRDKETGELYTRAQISGNNWRAELFLEEGERTLVCSANDAAGNQSTKSIKTLVYFVDETAPEGLSWYIDRGNNIQTGLKEKEVLEDMDYDDFTNIDIPQNEKFTIHGRFYDAMSIDTITLELYEDEIKVGEKTVRAETIGEGKSIYSPSFEFTAEDLFTLTTGQHFLKCRYYSKDDHGNSINRELPYLLWWPESDEPRIALNKMENNVLTVKIGSALPIHFFDDDSLDEIRYALLKSIPASDEEVKNSIKENPSCITWIPDPTDENVINGAVQTGISAQSKRDIPVQIKVPNNTCQLKLVTYAKDSHNEVNVKIVDVIVSDANQPILFVEAPAENAIPTIKEGTKSSFDLSGYALDTTGCREIKVAYVPGKRGSLAEARGKALIKGASPENGEFIKKVSLGTPSDQSGWKKQEFCHTFDLLTDFKNGDVSYAKEDKFFELCLIDLDENEVWKQMVVTGDNTAPKIDIISPDQDMWVYDYVHGEENLEIKFKALKDSGLGVDEDKYKVTVIWNESNHVEYSKAKGNLRVVDGIATVLIPKSEIASKKDLNLQPRLEFEAYDVLGNKAEGRYNVVLSPLPQLKSIISGNMNGTFKKGDKINFQAVFTDAVKVEGTPKLKLLFSADDTTAKYADYNGTGNRTDTLVFTYTVKENDVSDGLICDYRNPIVLASGAGITEITIKTANAGEGNAYLTTLKEENTLAGKEFKLDGVLPEIADNGIVITAENGTLNADGNYYRKAGEIIKAVVEFTEKVNINGSPKLKLYGGTDGTDAVDFALQSIDGKKITFTHVVSDTTPNGAIKYDFAKAFVKDSSGTNAGYVSTITDEAGNPVKLVKTTSDDKNIKIDTVPPSNAPVIGIAGGTERLPKKYNLAQTLTLTGEEGATIEYSPNGGVSWFVFDDDVSLTASGFTGKNGDGTSGIKTIPNGEYALKTRQTDKAGNTSSESSTVYFTINNTFPAVTSLVIAKADGKYPAGEKIKFNLTYAAAVRVLDENDAQLAFKIGSQVRTQKVKKVTDTSGSTKLEFEYEVTSEDEGAGIVVTGITYGETRKPVDLYGNSPASNISVTSHTGAYAATNRAGIVLDGKPPVISTYSPDLDEVVTNGNVVTLTFSENVEKESGLITLRRKSTAEEPWRIPPVLTEEEFNSVYNELDDTDKEVLIKMDGGAPRMFEKNGQPLGPYKRITHGLVGGDGLSTVPDTSTKFVLDFNIGIKNGSGYLADGTEVNVSGLRAAFEKAGYHKQEVEVTDASVVINSANKKQVKITFPKALVDGREWELFIAPGAFRDETGNLFAGLGYTVSGETATMDANSTYSFWSDKVAKPWIRVDRYSHGYAAIEPTVTESGTYDSVKIITSYGTKSGSSYANAATVQPTGYARVRIDCETPGSTIKYGWDGKVTGTCNPAATTSTLWTAGTTFDELVPTGITANKPYTGYFVVGDGGLYTGRRDFVKAQATKTGFTSSDNGYEGVFKTVVTARTDGNNKADYLKIEGGSGAGGMPAYGGFPVRDAEEGKGHDKGCYKVANQQFVWQSYDIVSTWWVLPYNQNYTSRYYWAGYGYATHIYQPAFYDGSQNGSDIAAGYTEVNVNMFK